MDGGFQFLDIIFFAVVAALLIIKLRSALGRHDGHRGSSRDPVRAPSRREAADDNVVRLPDRPDSAPDVGPADSPSADIPPVDTPAADDVEPESAIAAATGTLEAGLAQIRVADASFEPNEFLSGGRLAFEMILTSFAAGDAASLRPLLSPEVFANFERSILDREQAGERMQTTLVGIRTAELVEAYMAGRTAHVTVKFVSQQVTIVRDDKDEIIEGDPNTVTDVTDFWAFARDTRSRDPNWMLVATGSLE